MDLLPDRIVLRRTVPHGRQGQLGPAVVGPQIKAQHRHLVGEGVGYRPPDARQLGGDEVSADAERGDHRRLVVMTLVVDGDCHAECIEVVQLHALEDAVHQRHQLRVLARLKVRRSHVHSRVTTVATRSRPEMESSVRMGPVAGTISASLVVAATANKARTAALSQYVTSHRSTVIASLLAAARSSTSENSLTLARSMSPVAWTTGGCSASPADIQN